MMTLEGLKDGLFKRFITACDELSRIAEKRAGIVEWVYTTTPCYEIKEYGEMKVAAEHGPLQNSAEDYVYTYGLDDKGRPCYSGFGSEKDGLHAEGFYEYTDTFTEHITYSSSSGKPYIITRLYFEQGKKIGFQSFQANGGGLGHNFDATNSREMADKLRENNYTSFCTVCLYEYTNDRITGAGCWAMTPGIGFNEYKLTYTYDASGVLLEVWKVYPDNAKQCIYAKAPSHLTFQELADEISLLIAHAITDALQNEQIEGPIAIMQLGYREVSNYDPYVEVLSLKDQGRIIEKTGQADLLVELFIVSEKQYIPLVNKPYESLMTAFINIVEDNNDYESATAMIHKAGYLLTTERLWGKSALSEDFIAYPVDWSMAPDNNELIETMLKCGMRKETLEKWQQLGVFLPE